jgi:GT2 family glycosyltransferase
MNVAVVVLNWNGKKLLQQFLPSVIRHSKEGTVYVADNASTDGSISLISEKFPMVKIIQNGSNGGYAKGYNDALKNLSEDIFVLLNSDVEVTENWLVPVLSEFKNDAKLVAAQPKILDYKNKDYFEYAGAAGGFIDRYGYPFCRGRIFDTLEKDEGQFDDIKEIFWATGACLFIKKSAFKEVNGFDEDFFAHQEEIDLCWRLQSKGGIIKYVGASSVFHIGGATLAAANSKKTFYNFRNTLFVLVKNVHGSQLWLIIFTRLVLDGIAGIQFLLQGKPKHLLAIIKAHLSFYSLLPKMINKRELREGKLNYYFVSSVVWKYFFRKEKTFQDFL